MDALSDAKTGGGPVTTAGVANAARGRMALDEALLVFNIPKADFSPKAAETLQKSVGEKYSRLFEANDPSAGGSFYLQSKVFRAKESIDAELAEIAQGPREK
jgi:import inner membrane translocase subunit TIM16